MNSIASQNPETYFIENLITMARTGTASLDDVIEHNLSLSDAEILYDIFNKKDISV